MRCSVCDAAYDPGDRFCWCCGRRFPHPVKLDTPATDCVTDADPRQARKATRRLKGLAVATIALATLLLIMAQAAPDLIKLAGLKAKDLGVTWTQEDYDRAFKRVAVLVDEPPKGTDRSKYREEFSGSQQADWSFTESEITALFNGGNHAGYWPLGNVQVRLSEGNMVEFSGTVNAPRLLSYPAVAQCLPPEVKSYAASLPMDLPITAKAVVTVSGEKSLDITLESLEASGIPMMAYLNRDQANLILESIVNSMLWDAGPIRIDALETKEGSCTFRGLWYKELKRVPAAENKQ